jgi:hypothetical protein
MVLVMGRNVRIACVGTLVLLTGALVVQQGLGAPGPEPSIASDVRVGPTTMRSRSPPAGAL